ERALFGVDDPDLRAVEDGMALVASGRDALLSGGHPPPAETPPPSSPSRKTLSPSPSSLAALDDACLEVSRACTAFYRRVAVEEGPELVRPHGRRGGRGGRP
ncbi:MAG TPA: hypothetical protein VMN04_09635, partial [Thermoanaerobaculia bacterium]|nr:hypothetical protein [Thermoanaerobaculia bacterium]